MVTRDGWSSSGANFSVIFLLRRRPMAAQELDIWDGGPGSSMAAASIVMLTTRMLGLEVVKTSICEVGGRMGCSFH